MKGCLSLNPGFLDLFENKSARITGKQRFCVINNEIKCNCQLGYLNLQGEAVFEYLENKIKVDKNPRTNGFSILLMLILNSGLLGIM